jgi:signal transduction histidine kinase
MSNLETRLHHMERLLAISRELVANPFLNDILHQIVQAATELAACESAGILLLDEADDTLRFVAATQHRDRLFAIPVPIDASIAGAAFRSNQPVIAHDVENDPRYYSKVAELLDYPAYSLLAVPLTFRERKIGVLEVENKKNGRRFDAEDAQLMSVLAAQAASAIENARLFEQQTQLVSAEKRQRQMADALRLASAALVSTLDYDQVIDQILVQISEVIPNDASNVMILEEDNIARVFRGHGYAKFGTADLLDTITLNIREVAGFRKMFVSKRPLAIPDVTEDPTWVISRPEHRWIRSYVGVPIVVREAVTGFLNVMSATPNMYDQTHAARLQNFAYHAATAIENAQLYRQAQEEITERSRVEAELRRHRDDLETLVQEQTAEIIHQQRAMASLAERQRMARDLHDSVTQSIHSMVLFSETLTATLEKNNLERAQRIVNRLQESARQSLKETRLLLYQLQREEPHGHVDLIADLKIRLASVERRAGMDAELVQEGSVDNCPVEWHENLFWLVIEALNNALKHAQATAVQVTLRFLEHGIELEVQDNGIGFDPDRVPVGGMGLNNMHARAAALGGTLTITSERGQGTRVYVEANLEAE